MHPSLYPGSEDGLPDFSKESPIVSFYRPLQVSPSPPVSMSYYTNEFFSWAEKALSAYKIGYISDIDMDNYLTTTKTKLLIIEGHSEYWSRTARKNFDQFIAQGGNAIILSGNVMWWQVRYNSNKSQLICYKDRLYRYKDPYSLTDSATLSWNYAQLHYPIWQSIGSQYPLGGHMDYQGSNTSPEYKGFAGYKIVNQSSPLLDGTSLKNGAILHLDRKNSPLSGEYDGLKYNGFTKDNIPVPIIDTPFYHFYKFQLIGYDISYWDHNSPTVSGWIVFQKTPSSGIIVNVSCANWCREYIFSHGSNSSNIQHITLNMINKMINHQNVYAQ